MQQRSCFGSIPLTLATAIALVCSACGKPGAQTQKTEAVWEDPSTQLTWTTEDNGYEVTWAMARTYCAELTTSGFKWTLPTIQELGTLYYVDKDYSGYPINYNIKLTGSWVWSDTPERAKVPGRYGCNEGNEGCNSGFEAFHFVTLSRPSFRSVLNNNHRALCVRRQVGE